MRGSRYAKSTRPKRATHEGENEGETKHIFIRTQRTRMPQPPHATTFCLQSSISRSHSHTRGGQRASERDRTAAAARERRKIDVFGRLCGVQGHRLRDNLAALPAGEALGRPYRTARPGRGQLYGDGRLSGSKLGRFGGRKPWILDPQGWCSRPWMPSCGTTAAERVSEGTGGHKYQSRPACVQDGGSGWGGGTLPSARRRCVPQPVK